MDFIKKLSELNLWYIPLIVVAVVLLFGFWTGFWRGWKSSLYFMVWNLVGFYAFLFILDGMYDSHIKDAIKHWFGSVEDSLGPNAFMRFMDLFRGWLVLMAVLTFLSVWNFIAWLVHLFFKKRFKKHLIENKKAGKSNAGSRLLGGFFGLIAVIPASASAMASSTVLSSDKTVNKGTDKFVSGITFGIVPQLSEDWDAIYGLVLSAPSAENMANLFSGALYQSEEDANGNLVIKNDANGNPIVKDDAIKIDELKKASPSIIKMLNYAKSAEVALDVLKYRIAKNTGGLQHQTLDEDALKIIEDQNHFGALKGVFQGLTEQGKNVLKDIISETATTPEIAQKLADFLAD